MSRVVSPTRILASLGSEPPKLKKPGLALIERQTKLGQSLLERHQQSPRIAFILGANDTVVGIPNDHDLAARMPLAPLVYPGIKAVVQEDIGEERADPRSLGTSHIDRRPFTALQSAGLQPSLDQTNDPSVGDPVLQHP